MLITSGVGGTSTFSILLSRRGRVAVCGDLHPAPCTLLPGAPLISSACFFAEGMARSKGGEATSGKLIMSEDRPAAPCGWKNNLQTSDRPILFIRQSPPSTRSNHQEGCPRSTRRPKSFARARAMASLRVLTLAAFVSSCSAFFISPGAGVVASRSPLATSGQQRSCAPLLKRSAEERDFLELEGPLRRG